MTGEYSLSFELTTTSPLYATSEVYTLVITNIPETADPTPTLGSPTQTPTPPYTGCPADCNDDGTISIGELITAVQIALGDEPPEVCDSVDIDGGGTVGIDAELVRAVDAALGSCAAPE